MSSFIGGELVTLSMNSFVPTEVMTDYTKMAVCKYTLYTIPSKKIIQLILTLHNNMLTGIKTKTRALRWRGKWRKKSLLAMTRNGNPDSVKLLMTLKAQQKQDNKMICTCVASILSRWNWHIFPRAETALSYDITLSECSALGCRITTFNLVRASAKRDKRICIKATTPSRESIMCK